MNPTDCIVCFTRILTVNKHNLADDYLHRISAAQQVQHANGDSAGVVAAYDQLMCELLNTIEYASASERQTIRLTMSREGSGLLLGAAEGSATWAVREFNPQRCDSD